MALAPPPDLTDLAAPELRPSPIRYRFRLLRWADWREEGTPPVRNCTVQFPRNGIERVDASLALVNGMPDIRAGAEQLLEVEQDGVPLAAAAIQDHSWSAGSAFLTLQTTGWSALLQDRQIEQDISFEQEDQFDIARALLLLAQGWRLESGQWEPGPQHADLHIDPWAGLGVEAPKSGVLRDRAYRAIDNKTIGGSDGALTQLSQVVGGFDFRLRPVWRNGFLVFWPVFDFPPGQRRTPISLEYKRGSSLNVVDYTWRVAGSGVVNRAKASNDEETRVAEDPSAWRRWPLRTGSIQEGGEHGATRSETLEEHATAYLLQNRRPRESGTLTLRSDQAMTPDIVGSRVRFRATSWRHPPGPFGEPGFDEEVLVENLSISIGSDERATETKLEVSRLTDSDRLRVGFAGGAGRMGRRVDLGTALAEIRSLGGSQRQATEDLARVEENLATVAEEVGVTAPPPPPPPPPPAPPPAPPPVVDIEVLSLNVPTGIWGSDAQLVGGWFNIPRAGAVHVVGHLVVRPEQWVNNEGMGAGTRRVFTEISGRVASGQHMVGGSSPNWAAYETVIRDDWWYLPQGGSWHAAWQMRIGGGNRLRVSAGWINVRFVG